MTADHLCLIPILRCADIETRTYYADGVHEAVTNLGTVNTRVVAGSADNVRSAVEIAVSVVVSSSDIVVVAADWVYVHRMAGLVGRCPCISLDTWSVFQGFLGNIHILRIPPDICRWQSAE